MHYRVLCQTVGIARDEWLDQRRGGIGGSDAAAIAGLNPFCSPLTVWSQKRGMAPEKEDSEAMRQGRDLEAYVAARWTEATGKKTRRRNAILQHPDYDFIIANVDRLVVGENAGLECKTTSMLNAAEYAKEPPPWYAIQCHHYMLVTGADRWYLAILALNRAFIMHTIERDDVVCEHLLKIEREFWEMVQSGMPPEPDGSADYSEMLKERYSYSHDEEIVLTIGADRLAERERYVERIKKLEAEVKRIDQTIQLELGEAERGKCGQYIVTWKTQEVRRLDTKEIKAKAPELYEKYAKVSVTRPLRIKKIEE
jgi:putative phage-type endonuclease